MADEDKLNAKKFAVSFIQAKPWIKNLRFILGLVIVLLIATTIYRAWFSSGSQKSKHVVIALPGSRIESIEQTTDQKLTQRRPWWQPIPYVSLSAEARTRGSDLGEIQTGLKGEVGIRWDF